MHYFICLCFIALPITALSQTNSGRQYTEISGTGQSLFRIAIPPVIDGGGAQSSLGEIQSVMANDLTLIGLFKVLNPSGFLANLTKEGTGLDPSAWSNIGAQGVIKAKAQSAGGNLTVNFYLYDLAKGNSPVLTKSYQGNSSSIRLLAHRFGDEVVKYYTGERGIFTSKIAFAVSNPRSRSSQIYVMDYDGHGAHRISNTGTQNVLPAWSPSGQIAFTSYLWRNPDLFVVAGGGGRANRISKWPGLNTGAAWSPRGDVIALTLSKDGNSELYLINSQGKILRRLTTNSAIDTSPTWSPDGSRLAFVSNRGGSPQIYVISTAGGEARRLTFKGNYNQEPSWCIRKDTPLVAFTGRDERGNYDIFTINVDSGELKRLTQGEGSNKSPSWAPNGRLLVFSSSRGGLWLMDSEGLNQHRVYRGNAQTPAWSK